ncbi:AP-3 complex subunit mu-2, partial [Perkinsus olseni]
SIVVDDVVVSILLPTSVGSGCLQTSVKGGRERQPSPSIRVDTTSDGGSVVIWHVGQLASDAAGGEDTLVAATGTLSYRGDESAAALSAEMANEQRCIAQVGFSVRGWCISGLRLDSLEVSATGGSTLQKGCRYSTVAGLVD